MAQTQQRAGAKPVESTTEGRAVAKPVEPTTEERLAEIEARLDWIEANTPGLPNRETAEADQEARDNEILSRRPNNYEEAVEFEAALERRDERRGRSKPADNEEPKAKD